MAPMIPGKNDPRGGKLEIQPREPSRNRMKAMFGFER